MCNSIGLHNTSKGYKTEEQAIGQLFDFKINIEVFEVEIGGVNLESDKYCLEVRQRLDSL